MFGANIELPNRILSYNSALKKFNSIKPIRGRSTDTRPLARRSNDNLTIRQDPTTGDIAVRLYATDIITYKNEPDTDPDLRPIELDPYPSVLTNRVMWSILGPHVTTYWSDRHHSAPNCITEVGGRYYNTPSYALIQPQETGWTLIGGEKPFEVPRINRKEAKQALRDANFYTFQTWIETLIRLNNDPRPADGWRSRPYDWSPSEAYQYLTAGGAGWREIAGRMSHRVALDREMTSLRQAVYKYFQCYDTESILYFTSYREMQNAINRMRRDD